MEKKPIAELCGCCEPPSPTTPIAVLNRPGLSAIAYRIGTFASFRETMLEAIAGEPALKELTTRRSDDPAITLLELWAALADVLTFYQERIANEAFLRTARERDSVLRLVRLLDYHLRPGIAATTLFAFTVDDDATVEIPVGLRVMSTPGQDERPQIFEAIETITADSRLNRVAILPEPIGINPLAQERPSAFLTSDNEGWQAAKTLMPGDKVVLFNPSVDEGLAIEPSVFVEETQSEMAVEMADTDIPTYGEVMSWGVPFRIAAEPVPWGPRSDVIKEFKDWAIMSRTGMFIVPVESVFDIEAPEEKEIKEIQVEGNRFSLVWTKPIVKSRWSEESQAYVFTKKMRVFGYNAPATYAKVTAAPQVKWDTEIVDPSFNGSVLPLDTVYKDIVAGDQLLIYESEQFRQIVTVNGVSEGEEILGKPLPADSLADHRFRGTVTKVVFSETLNILDRKDVTVYHLKGSRIPLWSGEFSGLITAGRLYIPAVLLKLDDEEEAEEETEDNIAVEIGRTIEGRELKSGVAIRLRDIDIGRTVLLVDHTGRPIEATIVGRRVEIFEEQDFLVIDVTSLAEIALETHTAVMLGNVTEATHGETVPSEILGNGDAATSFQKFQLRKSPLTYIPSSQSVKGESTLSTLVNRVQWTEVSSLYGRSPTDTVYTARQTDEGTTILQFGDGVTGARLTSGQGNIIATYRQGSGLEGRLKADQLNILLNRPVGLKSATNPAATEGGADPESLDNARYTAPTTVKTFDRAVSLLDFESLTTASGEVAKAKATWVWSGLEKAVHLTLAGQEGDLFSLEKLSDLHTALTQESDPNIMLMLDNFSRVPIVVTAKIQVDDNYVRDDVGTEARQALIDYFAFEQIGFAQPVHISDIYHLLQEVPGVVYVDIDTLHFKGYGDWTEDQLAIRGVTDESAQAHLRIYAARPRPEPTTTADPLVSAFYGTNPLPAVLPAEQAYIEIEASDITLKVTGGLE